jgi:hypothetical protein
MGIALRTKSNEVDSFVNSGGGFGWMFKSANWEIRSCGGSTPPERGSERTTFIRTIHIQGKSLLAEGAASPGAVGIDITVDNGGTFKNYYVSPFYSAVISKDVKREGDKCPTSGWINVMERFKLYRKGASGIPDDYKPFLPPASQRISNDYEHGMYSFQGRHELSGSIISEGFMGVYLTWDCSQKVQGRIVSDVPVDVRKDLTRTERRDDWDINNRALTVGDAFEIPFK